MMGTSIKALCHFPCISCTLTESLPNALFLLPSHWVYTPLSLLLSLSFIPSLLFLVSPYFTSSHLLIDLYSFQAFPFCPPPPISSLIAACCTADRRTTSCALTLFSLATSPSLFLFLTNVSLSLFHTLLLSHTLVLQQPNICYSVTVQHAHNLNTEGVLETMTICFAVFTASTVLNIFTIFKSRL